MEDFSKVLIFSPGFDFGDWDTEGFLWPPNPEISIGGESSYGFSSTPNTYSPGTFMQYLCGSNEAYV